MINVSDNFHNAAFGQVIKPIVALYVSFDKQLADGGFFTLDESVLDGPDLLKFAGTDAAAQSWDFYDYHDYTDRLVSVSWERSLQFPYQVQCGMIDFTLSNTDGYFTPLNPRSSIGPNNLPARPMKLLAGFSYPGNNELIPQMVSITDGLPDVNQGSKTADYHAIDFLYDICNQPLTTVIDMREVRTDLVIAAILESYGLAPSQYHLAPGKYKIPFVFFDIGASVGDALKQLVQAENGFLWLDETGIVRFETPDSAMADVEIGATLSDYEIISIAPGELSDVVNHVKITAEIREVQAWQEVYTKDSNIPEKAGEVNEESLWVVPANGTWEVTCGLGDPCYDILAPTINKSSSVSWFTCIDDHLNAITNGVTATGVLSSNSYTITFTNTHSYPAIIDEMKLWGEPAKVYDVLNYDAYDEESLAKYGDQVLEISDNQFFQTYEQANNYARSIIKDHKEYTRTVVAEIKGDFSFQLMDLIKIDIPNGDYNDIYRITGIAYSWDGKLMTTKLTLTGTNIEEGMFTLNMSKLNGEDLLG